MLFQLNRRSGTRFFVDQFVQIWCGDSLAAGMEKGEDRFEQVFHGLNQVKHSCSLLQVKGGRTARVSMTCATQRAFCDG